MSETAPQSYPFLSTRKRREQVDYAILAEYRDHLDMDRGLKNCQGQLSAATCFLDFLRGRDTSIEAISKRDIDDFVAEQGAHYGKQTMATLAWLLRSLFRFLLAYGGVDTDWAAAVPRPRIFGGRRDPRYLKSREVKAILVLVDRASPVGIRNYAILVLLGLCGLRASEVAQLALDHIGWRSMLLRGGHRKCGDAFELPLLPTVAAALAAYVRVRPESGHREVFLSTVRPFAPLKANTVTVLARRAIQRAGIDVARPGSHSFRYAAAQALFEANRPISEIAAVLGHRDLRSTLGYLSFTVHPLREVALNDGEDLA